MQIPPGIPRIFLTLTLSIFFIFGKPGTSTAFNQETQDKVKKIVMMLNIAAKEFEEGVVDGKIVVPPEYEESKIFLKQASERFSRVSKEIENREAAILISQQFPTLMEMIENKVDSQKVWDEVNNTNSNLMTTFGIEINKIPIKMNV